MFYFFISLKKTYKYLKTNGVSEICDLPLRQTSKSYYSIQY